MAKLSERVQEQQARRTRRPLPPAHPRPVTPEAGVSAEPDDQTAQVIDLTAEAAEHDSALVPTSDSEPPSEHVAGVATAVRTSAPPKAAATIGTPASRKKARHPEPGQEPVVVPLEPRQVWLDQQNDLWLSECEYANVRRGGRKVISRSSVVRLALDRLRDAMTPEQITDLLADREPMQAGRGRPRR
jgi:hypothetical protein